MVGITLAMIIYIMNSGQRKQPEVARMENLSLQEQITGTFPVLDLVLRNITFVGYSQYRIINEHFLT